MIDIKQIAERLISSQETILTQICPGGTISGREYTAGSITGGPGKSFSFNLQTGKWADFATGEKGGDIISLYAQVNRINNAEAAKILQEQFMNIQAKPQHHYPVKTVVDITIIKPPRHAVKPEKPLNKGITPSFSWTYRDHDGEPLFYIFRYDMPDNTKTFTPLSFSSNGQWVKKQWPSPRPLYNLDKLTQNPNKHVLVVEGEKAADAAEQMQSLYIVTTWPGGVNAIGKTDFTPLHGRKLLLWPDGDEPGIKGMNQLAAQLRDHAAEIKIINPDRNSGWDAYDAFSGGMTQTEFIKWAKPLVRIIDTKLIEEKATFITSTDHAEPRHVTAELVNEKPDAGSVALYVQLGFVIKSEKNPLPFANEFNVALALETMRKYSGHIWFDEFYQDLVTDHTTGVSRKWLEHDELNLLCELQSKWHMPALSKYTMRSAIRRVAFANIRNELKDWLESFQWDGVERISEFFINAYGCDDNEYNRIISKNWLIGLVARGMKPGCKFDEMLVLEGKQGTYKSTSLRALAGKYFAESNAALDGKDFMQELAGTWIVEFDELDQFRKAESTLIKKKLSQQTDRYRPPYAEKPIDVPRTCVFVGTTNSTEWLTDTTGNRRFWPISVRKADLDYINENREQLFAEAVALFKSGVHWHEVPEQTIAEQEMRREQDPWEEIIGSALKDQNKMMYNSSMVEITASRIASHILGIRTEMYDNRSARRIGRCMRVLNYSASGAVRLDDGSVSKVFTKNQ
jgi:putative DNA primase/helicase